MSKAEALRTQLDALRTDFYSVEAENRRLREERPQEAATIEIEKELTETRSENVRLVQEISRLETASGRPDAKSTAAHETEIRGLRETVETMEQMLSATKGELEEKRAALERATVKVQQAEAYVGKLEAQLELTCREAELERFRAVAEETRKWERREERMLQQIKDLERGVTAGSVGVDGIEEELPASSRMTGGQRYVTTMGTEGTGSPAENVDELTACQVRPGTQHSRSSSNQQQPCVWSQQNSPTLSVQASPFNPRRDTSAPMGNNLEHRGLSVQPGPQRVGRGAAVEPVPTLAATPLGTLSMALFAQQLPSLPNFSGDNADTDEECFSEWLERLELVATTCGWDDQAKLVNVATRLRGAASRFYRSCPPQQRATYSALTSALQQRFTPVRIQSVQSSKFHERMQRPTESVDSYAQDLRKLFYQAYSRAQQEGGGAEIMGQSVLAYQFVAGLTGDLKAKLVGCEGTFDELLVKARFEEARLRDVVRVGNPKTHQTPPAPQSRRYFIPAGGVNGRKGEAPRVGGGFHCTVCTG